MKPHIFVFIFSFYMFNSANAQTLNFDDFLNTAVNNSYEIKLAKLNKNQAEYGIKEARSEYFPTLNGYATVERYNDLSDSERQITAVGNEILLNRDYFQDMASLALSYNIFDYGIRKKELDIAKTDNKQKEILLLKSIRDLKLDVVDIYSETLNLYKQSQIKKQILAIQTELVDINTRLKAAGELSEISVIDVKIEQSENKTDLDIINNTLAKKLTEISYYTGEEYELNNISLEDFPTNPSTQIKDDVIKLSAEKIVLIPENSPEAKTYDLEIKKKQKEYEIQKRANFPKLRFDTRYNLYGSDTNNFTDSFQDIAQRSFSLRLSTTFTLFDGFKNINAAHKKKIEIAKLKVEKEKELAELKKKFDQIQLDANNSLIQNENNEKTLALVNENLNNLERLNANGLIEKSQVLKKHLQLLEKKQKLEENKIKNYVALYKLKILTEEITKL